MSTRILLGPALGSLEEVRAIGFLDKSLDHLLRRPLREQERALG